MLLEILIRVSVLVAIVAFLLWFWPAVFSLVF